MRLIRAAGQNVSPSDDGRLYDQIFSDGLFTDTAFAALGTNNVQVGAMYGDLCGRDFTIEQQTITVPLPEGDGETTGYIYVEIDTSAETPLSVGASLSPFTPTYEDINVNGAVAQMIVAEYTASAVAVTSVTATYTRAAAGSVKAGSIATVESSPVTANHAIGEYILYGGTVYRVTAAIATGETIVPGTNVIAESVGDALTELNNGLTPKTLEYTATAGSGVSLRKFAAYRSNNVVNVCVYFDVTSAVSNNGTIVSLDKALPHPLGQYGTSAVRSATGTGTGVVSLESGDPIAVRAWGSIPTGTYYFADIVYLTGD